MQQQLAQSQTVLHVRRRRQASFTPHRMLAPRVFSSSLRAYTYVRASLRETITMRVQPKDIRASRDPQVTAHHTQAQADLRQAPTLVYVY